MNNNLAVFIRALENSGLLTFNIMGDEDEHFRNRLKIQKLVYLAKYFGLDLGYSYSMYLHGPYSPSLANDYYDIATDYESEYINNRLPDGFRMSEFVSFLRGKDIPWLEAASTLISLHDSFRDKDCLVNRAANMKQHIERERIASVLNELESRDLLTFGSSL